MSDTIYFDHAAATPLDPAVLAAMQPYLSEQFANPSSLYAHARLTRRAVEEARARVARVLGAKPTEIVWTSGGTESVNGAIQGVLRAHPRSHWVTTSIEHDAVLAQCAPMERDGHPVTTVAIDERGIVGAADIEAAITDETVLISVMLANNEVGTIQPVAEISKIIASIREDRTKRGISLPLYLHSDACQASPYLDLHVMRLGVDLLSLNGSKMYGPKGVGLLYVRTGTTIEPLIYGGGQERGRRSGTENVAGIVGLATALDLVTVGRQEEAKRLSGLRDELIRGVMESVPEALLNGDAKHRLPSNANFSFPGAAGQALVLYLEQAGILASTGSACSSGDLDPSHVLLAIGRSREEATGSLRLSLGRSTMASDIVRVVEVLPQIVARVRELSQA